MQHESPPMKQQQRLDDLELLMTCQPLHTCANLCSHPAISTDESSLMWHRAEPMQCLTGKNQWTKDILLRQHSLHPDVTVLEAPRWTKDVCILSEG